MQDIVAEFLWGSSSSDFVSPSICVSKFPFLTSDCLSTAATKCVGIAIISAAFLNKAPIFRNIFTNKSVVGLSTSAIYGEVIMYSNGALYGVLTKAPFTAYGETLCVASQTICLALLLWHYNKASTTSKASAVGFYVAYLLLSILVLPPQYYSLLIVCNWPALIISRGSQIRKNALDKHTGTQSVITHLMNLTGSLVRIATTMKEIGMDTALLCGYSLSVLLNAILVLQCIMYSSNTEKVLSGSKKKE